MRLTDRKALFVDITIEIEIYLPIPPPPEINQFNLIFNNLVAEEIALASSTLAEII